MIYSQKARYTLAFVRDDIPQQVADDIQGYALICLQKCGIIKPRKAVNLMLNKIVCPFCGVDSVLPDNKVELSTDLLEDMHKIWFE